MIYGEKHFITTASKNAVESLSMAMETVSKDLDHLSITEISRMVEVLNKTALMLKKACREHGYRLNSKKE